MAGQSAGTAVAAIGTVILVASMNGAMVGAHQRQNHARQTTTREIWNRFLMMDTMLPIDIVKSISSDEDAILLGIMRLHNDGEPFCADATYSVGGLYRKNVPAPKLKFDISPITADVTQADVKDLPLKNHSIKSIIFDPPFMFNPHGTALVKNAANARYTMFRTWADLEQTYKGALVEFRRVLRPGGIVAFKCQDYTDTKTTMTHCHVWQWATGLGFYAKDLFVRYRLHGPAYNPNLKQKHARKFHSYWFVFEKQGKSLTAA